jgi:hypothetical protein
VAPKKTFFLFYGNNLEAGSSRRAKIMINSIGTEEVAAYTKQKETKERRTEKREVKIVGGKEMDKRKIDRRDHI